MYRLKKGGNLPHALLRRRVYWESEIPVSTGRRREIWRHQTASSCKSRRFVSSLWQRVSSTWKNHISTNCILCPLQTRIIRPKSWVTSSLNSRAFRPNGMASWGAIICQGIVVKSVWTCAQFVPSARNTKLNGLNKLKESNAVCGIYVLGKIIFFHPLEKKEISSLLRMNFTEVPT